MAKVFDFDCRQGNYPVDKITGSNPIIDGGGTFSYKTYGKGSQITFTNNTHFNKAYKWIGDSKFSFIIWFKGSTCRYGIKGLNQIPDQNNGTVLYPYAGNMIFAIGYNEGNLAYVDIPRFSNKDNILVVTFDGTRATNETKLSVYKNNVKIAPVFHGTLPSSIPNTNYPNFINYVYSCYRTQAFNHTLTQKEIYADYKQFLEAKPLQTPIYFK
jgi:hypothetical protein